MNEESNKELQSLRQTERLREEVVGINLWRQFTNFLFARVASENLYNEKIAKQAIAAAVALLAPDFIPEEVKPLAKEAAQILNSRLG